MKTKKLIKEALKKPKLFTKEELMYFKRWLYLKKKSKAAKIIKRKEEKD
tara:strand:- start:380 stop:526 length:147 start_codon:yes stop_codon:yes gene_type:complete